MQISEERSKQVDQHMLLIPESSQRVWCDGGWCACMGCANKHGLQFVGDSRISEEEWLDWFCRHPPKGSEQFVVDGYLDYDKWMEDQQEKVERMMDEMFTEAKEKLKKRVDNTPEEN